MTDSSPAFVLEEDVSRTTAAAAPTSTTSASAYHGRLLLAPRPPRSGLPGGAGVARQRGRVGRRAAAGRTASSEAGAAPAPARGGRGTQLDPPSRVGARRGSGGGGPADPALASCDARGRQHRRAPAARLLAVPGPAGRSVRPGGAGSWTLGLEPAVGWTRVGAGSCDARARQDGRRTRRAPAPQARRRTGRWLGRRGCPSARPGAERSAGPAPRAADAAPTNSRHVG